MPPRRRRSNYAADRTRPSSSTSSSSSSILGSPSQASLPPQTPVPIISVPIIPAPTAPAPTTPGPRFHAPNPTTAKVNPHTTLQAQTTITPAPTSPTTEPRILEGINLTMNQLNELFEKKRQEAQQLVEEYGKVREKEKAVVDVGHIEENHKQFLSRTEQANALVAKTAFLESAIAQLGDMSRALDESETQHIFYGASQRTEPGSCESDARHVADTSGCRSSDGVFNERSDQAGEERD